MYVVIGTTENGKEVHHFGPFRNNERAKEYMQSMAAYGYKDISIHPLTRPNNAG